MASRVNSELLLVNAILPHQFALMIYDCMAWLNESSRRMSRLLEVAMPRCAQP